MTPEDQTARIEELERENQQLAAQNQASNETTPAPAPEKTILEQLHEHPLEGPHSFITALRAIATKLVEEEKIVTTDFLAPAEHGQVIAVIIKLVGELLTKGA